MGAPYRLRSEREGFSMRKTAIAPERHRRKAAISSAIRVLRSQLVDPTPEERLWFAVIEHAVRDAYSIRDNHEQLRADALRWIDSEYFDGVATAIGLHPRWAREKIKLIPTLDTRH
ncbi:MAG: hypothetical protein Kow0092_14820 [Deferrisomatales bacterium]